MNEPFARYAAIEELYTQTVMPVCEKFGLTYMELTVLLFLFNNPGYDTAAQIVRMRRLTKSHVSISVRGLKEKGLVVGKYRGSNNRTVHLEVQNKAMPIVSEGKAAQQRFTDILFFGFTAAEKEMLSALFDKMDRNVAQQLLLRSLQGGKEHGE